MTDKKIFPAVSVIIPMYNMEKYIGECLDSILAQTFKDYELLVVDDCSTDNSLEIVESYIPKFDGRLNLIRSEKNSGSCPGIPRNIAIDLARGEYIMFIDADDAVTPTALEELYPIAKKFDADILHCQKYYELMEDVSVKDKKNLKEVSEERAEFVTEPVLMFESLAERVEDYGFHRAMPVPWNKLFRRKLITENNITFPKFHAGSDIFFNFFALCLAKNVVHVPNIYYIYRQRTNSVCRKELPSDRLVQYWSDHVLQGMSLLDKFMDRFELFRDHAEYKYLIFETPMHYGLWHMFPLYENIPNTKMGGFMPAAQIDNTVREELKKIEDPLPLMAVMFNRMFFFQVQRIKYMDQVHKQKEQIEQLQGQVEILQSQLKELQK